MVYLDSKLNENDWMYSLAEITIKKLLERGSQKWSCFDDATKSRNSAAALPKQVNGGSNFVLPMLRFTWRT